MKKCYYLFDMDGTLLNDDLRIPQGTIEFLLRLQDEGHLLGIATGRPYEGIKSAMTEGEFQMFSFITSYNGARIDFEGETIEHKVPLAELDQFINTGTWTTTVSLGDTLYTDHIAGAKDIIDRLRPKHIHSLTSLTEDVYSIRLVFKSRNEAAKHFEELLQTTDLTRFNVMMSTSVYILITHKKASKAHAINDHLLDYKTIFFGDSENDLPVFELEHITTVAPKNATREIKKLADHVLSTTNNETLNIYLGVDE